VIKARIGFLHSISMMLRRREGEEKKRKKNRKIREDNYQE
jgi:hypothetical protein